MICYKDKTFCASVNCKNDCGRKLTRQIIEDATKADLPLSFAFFCGDLPFDYIVDETPAMRIDINND